MRNTSSSKVRHIEFLRDNTRFEGRRQGGADEGGQGEGELHFDRAERDELCDEE